MSHHDHDEPTAAQMNAVAAIPLPGLSSLLALLLRLFKTFGLSEGLERAGKAAAKLKIETRAAMQALADESEILSAKFHCLGANCRIQIVKESNRPGPQP